MKKRQIILDFLFPVDQESTGTIEPGMGALHHPTSSPETRKGHVELLLLPMTADVRRILMGLGLISTVGIVIINIGASSQ